MGDIISFGLWIKRRRKALDLTQAELARRVSCSLDLIQKIEADARRPSREIAALLATHLQLADDERASFIQVARAELGAYRLAPPTQSVARGAFVAAQARSSADEMPGAHQTRRPTHLPIPPTVLIGRDQEVATVIALVRRADMRLLTLTGSGGVGKTRLGLQIAADLSEDFADGVYFVDLAPVRDATLVGSTIAQTLGVRERGGQPLLECLKDFLRDKCMLLLLDNFEHLLDAAALVAELLASAAQLRVLVTSREVLHLRGEQEFVVPPLALPNPANVPALDQLAQYAAIRLFVQRGQSRQPDFQLTSANAPAIAEICARLDGLPLAIELAAARTKLFPPQALLARLSGRLALLSGGSRDLPTRQQTMRTTIAWSYGLLTEAEQILFRRLGVFVGGCTLEAAEEVLRTADRGLSEGTLDSARSPQSSVLDGLTALIDKSLLQRVDDSDSAVRFVMLETIREYALERLETSGEAEPLRRQHAGYYEVFSPRQPAEDDDTWKRRVERDYNNLRAALEWSQTTADDSEVALRLSLALIPLWHNRGRPLEAITALQRTLAHSRGVGCTTAHAQARGTLALLIAFRGNYAAARSEYEQTLSLWRELGDRAQCAGTLERIGWVAREQGDSATAWRWMTESLAIFRALSDARGAAGTLLSMAGIAIMDEDPVRAEALLAECGALAQQEDVDCELMFWIHNHLGHAAQLRGAYDRAAQHHQESLNLYQTPGAALWNAPLAAYQCLGETALGQGRLAEAADWLLQALDGSQAVDDQACIAWCLAGLGSLAALDEAPERAAWLWGAAERLRQAIGCRPAPAARATYERALVVARAQLGDQAFATAWERGRALTAEQAIAEAFAKA